MENGSYLIPDPAALDGDSKQSNILRKTIERYQNSFDFITFGNIIFKQIIFVIDRFITMQFTKMQIESHGSSVTIRYYAKCADPLYPNLALSIFAETFTRSLLMF